MNTVYIEANGRMGRGTTVTTPEGTQIQGITAIDLAIRVDEPITASIELWSSFKGEAIPIFIVKDPRTGTPKRVAHILFEDGTEFSSK